MKRKKFNSKKNFRISICLATCFFINSVPASVKAQPVKDTLFINQPNGDYPLYKHLYIYKTDKLVSPGFVYNNLKAGDFIRLFPKKSYNETITVTKHYWLMAVVKSNLAKDETFYYQLNSQQPDLIEGFQKSGQGGFKFIGLCGSDVAFDLRVYGYYSPVIPVVIKPGETVTLLLLVNDNDGQGLYFLPQLQSTKIFKGEEESFYTVTGVIIGLMFTVFILNSFLAISLKEKLHIYYGLYIINVVYLIFNITGVDLQLIYPGHPMLAGYFARPSMCTLFVLMTLIMQQFLRQNKINSKVKVFADIGLWCFMVMLVFDVILIEIFEINRMLVSIYELVLSGLALIQILLLIASAVEKVIQKYKAAWLYLTAVIFFFISIIEYITLYLFGINYNRALKQYPNDIEIALIIETGIVFLGIVYQYNLFKNEKEKLVIDLYVQQQNLVKNIITAEEAERKRIAADLHDDVGATLSALSMYISNAKQYLENKPEFEKYYLHGLALSSKAANDIRDIAHNLLPKDFIGLGLFTILEERINHLNANSPIRFCLITEGDENKLKDVVAITVYRIINELLNNIYKHSMAAEAAIQILIEDTGVQIMAEDDGIGFNADVKADGIGLRNIKDRVEFLKGKITVDNYNGTQVIINIPL